MRAVTVLALLMVTTGCSKEQRLRIGAKNFTEQYVLGEIIARHIGNRLHIHISRHFGIGGALLAQQATENGDIDLFPEYTGTALTSVLKRKPAPNVMEVLREGYKPKGLIWLDSLGFENTFAMVVRREDTGASNLSDAAKERAWRLGVGFHTCHSANLPARIELRLQSPPQRQGEDDGPWSSLSGSQQKAGGYGRGQQHGWNAVGPAADSAYGRSPLLPALRMRDYCSRTGTATGVYRPTTGSAGVIGAYYC